MAVLMRVSLLVPVLVPVLVLLAGCRSGPEQWGPFRGQIVDAETGTPIAGAHVMVLWERDIPNPVHWTQAFYDAQEAMTDEDGLFEMPRENRLLTLFVSTPRFAVFAPHYVPEAEELTPPSGRLYVDPTVVKMRPLRTQEEQCKHQPHGIRASVPESEASRFAAALDNYLASLRCAEVAR